MYHLPCERLITINRRYNSEPVPDISFIEPHKSPVALSFYYELIKEYPPSHELIPLLNLRACPGTRDRKFAVAGFHPCHVHTALITATPPPIPRNVLPVCVYRWRTAFVGSVRVQRSTCKHRRKANYQCL